MTAAADAVVEEIAHALGFFWSATTDERIDQLYVSGGTAHTPGCDSAARRPPGGAGRIDGSLHLHTDVAASLDARTLQHRACEFAIAMGLAMRQSTHRMIRINLLSPEDRHRPRRRQPWLVAGLGLVIGLAVTLTPYVTQARRLAALDRQIDDVSNQLQATQRPAERSASAWSLAGRAQHEAGHYSRTQPQTGRPGACSTGPQPRYS